MYSVAIVLAKFAAMSGIVDSHVTAIILVPVTDLAFSERDAMPNPLRMACKGSNGPLCNRRRSLSKASRDGGVTGVVSRRSRSSTGILTEPLSMILIWVLMLL